jgi:hypothetical protein
MARFTAPIPSWVGSVRRPVLDRRSAFGTTQTTIMISRADGESNQGNPAGGRDHASSVAETEAALSRAEDFR